MTELYLSVKKYMINSNANFIVWKHHWLLPVLQCLGESASTGGKCGGSHLPASAVPNPKDHIDLYSNAMHVLSFKIIHFLAAFNSSLLKRKKIFPFFVFLSFLLKRKLTTWAQQHLTLEMKLNCHFFFFFHFTDFWGVVKSIMLAKPKCIIWWSEFWDANFMFLKNLGQFICSMFQAWRPLGKVWVSHK